MRKLKLFLISCIALYLTGCVTPPFGGSSPAPTIPPSGVPGPTAGVPIPSPSGETQDSQDSESEGEGEGSEQSSTEGPSGSATPPPTGSGAPGGPQRPQSPQGGSPGENQDTADSGESEDGSGNSDGSAGENSDGDVADIPVWESPEGSGGGDDGSGGGGRFSDADLEDLERTLDEALGTFDGDILREQENARDKTGNVGSAGGQSQPEVFAGVGEFERAGSAPGETTESESGDGENQQVFNDGPPPSPKDDVVARQIREAAEREPDPEQRKILWQEYERYRDGG